MPSTSLSPANKIVRFLRANSLPVPQSAAMSALQRFWAAATKVAPIVNAAAMVLSLGGDTQQKATDPLALLARPQANLDLAFELLNSKVIERTSWPDLTRERAAMQSYLTMARQTIQELAPRHPQQAAAALAALFQLYGFGSSAHGDTNKLKQLASAVLARSGLTHLARASKKPANQAAAQAQQLQAQQQTRSTFSRALRQAQSANEQLTSIQSQAAQLQAQAQKLMRQQQQQATGGMAARGKLSQTPAQLESVLQQLRALYTQANAPVAAIKQAAAQMQKISARAGAGTLAPETIEALQQVARWAEAANGWRTQLNKTINHQLAPWLQQAYQYLEKLKAKVTHTTSTSTGSAVGAPADGVNQRHMQEQAKLLQRLAQQAYDRLRAGMNLGSFQDYLSQLAETNGVSEAALKSALNAYSPEVAKGLNVGVRASGGAASGATSGSTAIDLAVADAGEQLSQTPVLRRMSEGGLTPQQWQAWAHHRYHLAQGLFQNLLEECIAAAIKLRDGFAQESSEWRAANNLVENLQLNLKDELGGWRNPNDPDYSLAPHETWRQRAYQALAEELRRHGLGDPRQSTLEPEGNGERISDVFANRVREMIARATAPNAMHEDYYRLIALFAGVEAGIPTEYSQVLPGLARDFPGSFGDPMANIPLPEWVRAIRRQNNMYFADHINHDREHHLPGITEPLKRLLVNSLRLLKIVIDEINAITDAKNTFYEKLGAQTGIGAARSN